MKRSQLNVVKLRLLIKMMTVAWSSSTMLENYEEVNRVRKYEENIRKI